MKPDTTLTVEQIRAKLAGLPVPQTSAQRTADKLERTAKQVDRMVNKIASMKKSAGMTPVQIRQGLDLLFQKYDFNPAEELIRTSMETDDVSLATRINMFLVEFVLPKLKSIEVSGSIDHNHSVVIRRFGPGGEIQDSPAKVLGRITKPIDAEVLG